MRKSHLIALVVYTLCIIVPSACTGNNQEAASTGKAFLMNMYRCDFKACDALCTENGRREVCWFASNLTEDDLPCISADIEISAEECEVTDSSATIVYQADNVIVCDSLETKGYLGRRTLTVRLKKEKKAWKVDKLEW